ncbi:unnamed protein product [Schistosoma curassoni]|uniref:G_PROTEIN_RECEP_F1_2 domain-containing protein n=1 Tax=Schistosoma curassoni TaxID=6186 RepID=A0A183KY01_9TREM|nr:unnamed protein product [Schistosoma curassoni]
MESSNLNSLIAKEEENIQKLVLKNYIPTLIIISCFLVCISIFGLIGNWLVVHTIGRHIFRRFFKLLENCLCILCNCSRCKTQPENPIQNQKRSQYRQDICQQRLNPYLDVCLSRTSSLVPISQSTNSVSNNELRNQGNSLTSVNNTSTLNIHQSIETGTDCNKNKETTKKFIFTKRTAMHTDLNSDLLIVLLAINDLIICVIDIPTTIFLIVWETRTYDFICRLHVILKSFTLTVSALFLVIIALDRWLLVCFIPCVIMTKKCMKRLIVGTYILGILWAIPMGLHHGVHSYFKISTVDKLVSSDSEAIFMFHESNSLFKTNLSEFNDSISNSSSVSSEKSSLAYFTSQFIDLISSFTNYGYCKSDERFISQSDYEIYQLSILILFSLIFTCICIFYGYLFLFIMIHQYRWRTKFGPKIKVIEPINTPLTSPKHDVIINKPVKQSDFICFNHNNRSRFLSVQLNQTHLNNKQYQNQFNHSYISFIISYLPNLLIANRFIWPINWELLMETTNQLHLIYNYNIMNKTNSLLYNNSMITEINLNNHFYNHQLYNITNNNLLMNNSNEILKIKIKYHLRRFFHYLYFINSAANPLIYFFFNLKFRLQLKYLIHCFNTCFNTS